MQSSQFSVQHSLHLVTRLIENMNVIKVIQILLSEEIFGACRAVPKKLWTETKNHSFSNTLRFSHSPPG